MGGLDRMSGGSLDYACYKMKHILFKNKQEHWKWCYDNYFKYYGNFNNSPWDEEDQRNLQALFDWQELDRGTYTVPMSNEVKQSVAYYDKVRDKGMEARERIDFIERIERDQLLEIFGFERKYESDFEDDEECEKNFTEPELAIELSYPCIMVCSLSASWDRIGDITEVVVDYVEWEETK
jgi:hypothetical protein